MKAAAALAVFLGTQLAGCGPACTAESVTACTDAIDDSLNNCKTVQGTMDCVKGCCDMKLSDLEMTEGIPDSLTGDSKVKDFTAATVTAMNGVGGSAVGALASAMGVGCSGDDKLTDPCA